MSDPTEQGVEVMASRLVEKYAGMPDPRDPRGVRHPFDTLVISSLLAVFCGADTCADVHLFSEARYEWLSSFLDFPHGLPSPDTYERVFQVMRPAAWYELYRDWLAGLPLPRFPEGQDEVIAIDGKTARASRSSRVRALHTVTAYSTNYGLALANESVPMKSNEITVIPDLLNLVEPAGAIITTDAMGAQKEVASTIRDHHADYALALKDNHPSLKKVLDAPCCMTSLSTCAASPALGQTVCMEGDVAMPRVTLHLSHPTADRSSQELTQGTGRPRKATTLKNNAPRQCLTLLRPEVENSGRESGPSS